MIEFLVALAILAILSGLGAANYSDSVRRTRLVAEAGDLLQAIELTRAESSARGVPVTMLPAGGDWAAGWTIFVDGNLNQRIDSGEAVIWTRSRLAATTRIATDTTPGYVAYGPNGESRRYNGAFLAATITLCSAGQSRSIVIAKGGRPRISIGTC